MTPPSRVEREALLDLLLALGGPLLWTGPVPYDALAARCVAAGRVAPPPGGPDPWCRAA